MQPCIAKLKYILSGEVDNSQSLLCFYGPQYPGLFFSQFFIRARNNGLRLTTLPVEEIEFSVFSAATQMSFLGQTSLFWCPGLVDCTAAKKKELIAYLEKYVGPNRILVWSDSTLGKSSVEFPAHVDQKLFKELWQLLYPDTLLLEESFTNFFRNKMTLSWDAACMIIHYMQVFDNQDAMSANFLKKIIEPERSLFTLSQYFFAKQSEFLELWQAIETAFPPEFWIAFWSEQLWQAALFVDQVLQVGPQAARKGINRLPFSFMQKDWKGYTVRELCAAHNFLYSVDYGIKNGHATNGLELFLFKFIQGDFSRK
jgi:hypothetical protein